MRLLLLLVSIILGGVTLLYSQSYNDSRTNIYIIGENDNQVVLAGAHVNISSGRDSIAGVATKYNTGFATLACFRSNKVFKDSVDLRISYVGYKPFHQRYSAEQFTGRIYVEMEQDENLMSQIVVIGQSIAMVIKGDTTIYNSAAFKTMEGDRFSELLKQLPGVEIKENKIYANGEEIKRVYVDGKNLFGSNAAHTLTDIEASDVRNVKVYEEESPQAKRLEDKTAPKDRVMDVVTNSKRSVIKGGSVSVAGGASLEKDYSGKHELRHTEDLSLYRNSETGSIRLNASNSENDSQKEYVSVGSKVSPSEQTNVHLMYDYRRGDSTTIMTYANFARNSNQNISTALTEYFPSDNYQRRVTESVSNAVNKSWNLSASNNLNFMRRKNVFSSSIGFDLNQSKNRSNSETTQTLDQEQISTQRNNTGDADNVKINADFRYQRKLSEKSYIMIYASGNYSKQSNNQWNVDTLASTPGLRVVLNNDANGRQTNISANSEFKRDLNDHSAITLVYTFAHTYNKSKQMSIDYLSAPEGVVDNVNSYDYTVNSYWNTLSTTWNYRKGETFATAGLRGIIYDVNNDERLPNADNSTHTFFLFNPFVNFSSGSMQNRWYFSLMSFPDVLSVEMLRNSLDASNPLFIRAGNSNLKPSNQTGFRGSYSTTDAKEARTLSFDINGEYTFNYIATKQTLFMQDTYLPEYDYTAQNGSQLTSNLNVGGNYSLGASIRYAQRVSFLKSTLRTAVNYTYRKTPYYLGEDLYKSNNHEMRATVGIDTGFSENIRINLDSQTGLGYYTTNNDMTRYIRQSLNGSIDLRFASKYFASTKAAYELYDNNKPGIATQNNVIANAAIGRKFGKENPASLSLGVVDIFNQTSYISTLLNSDYIQTSTKSYLGRYGYLMFSYTF